LAFGMVRLLFWTNDFCIYFSLTRWTASYKVPNLVEIRCVNSHMVAAIAFDDLKLYSVGLNAV
jgi:hypothetical protein